MSRGVLDIFLIYQFLRRLVTPFNQWDAYKVGLINDKGEIIVDKENRTAEQEKSWGYYDRLIANLKKLLGKIPGGKTRIASFAAALLLLRESNIDENDLGLLEEKLNYYLEEMTLIQEEVANNVGDGNIAGTTDEPIVKKKKVLRRKTCLT